jgi:uncharacterized protein (UPF0128 family)
MEDYKKLCKELIEDHIKETMDWDKKTTRKAVLLDLQENGNDNIFGNIDGSRTCSTYEAQQFIDKSGAIWDTDIHELFDDIGDSYFIDTLGQGAEALDVVILELLSGQVINEMLESIGA